jgi:hypothetical protein
MQYQDHLGNHHARLGIPDTFGCCQSGMWQSAGKPAMCQIYGLFLYNTCYCYCVSSAFCSIWGGGALAPPRRTSRTWQSTRLGLQVLDLGCQSRAQPYLYDILSAEDWFRFCAEDPFPYVLCSPGDIQRSPLSWLSGFRTCFRPFLINALQDIGFVRRGLCLLEVQGGWNPDAPLIFLVTILEFNSYARVG